MSNFRFKLLGLATMVTAFAGLSYGQAPTPTISCSVAPGAPNPNNLSTPAVDPSSTNPTIRQEGETEEVQDVVGTCVVSNAAIAARAATITESLGSFQVTSKALTVNASAAVSNSDALLIICPAQATAVSCNANTANSSAYLGAVNSNSVTFTGVTLGNPAAAGGVFSFRIANVRVNASSGTAGGSVVATVQASYPVPTGTSYQTLTSLAAPATVAIIQKSLSSGLVTGNGIPAPAAATPNNTVVPNNLANLQAPLTSTSYFVCTGNVYLSTSTTANLAPSFIVQVQELFGGAFKSLGAFAAAGTGTENGSVVGQGGITLPDGTISPVSGIGQANSATQIAINLAGVPAGATVIVPSTISATSNQGNLVLTATGGAAVTSPTNIANIFSQNPGAANPALGASSFATASNGTATVVYSVQTAAPNAGPLTLYIPVYIQFASSSSLTTGTITEQVSYYPTGTATSPSPVVPQFAAPTGTPTNASAINGCQTSLLFPFVTNQLGFDTGIAISNTSQDALSTVKTAANYPSSVAPQSGTCTLSFFGNTAPSPATGVAMSAATAAGATSVFTISQVAPGFQGYMIASCPFLYAHGFAFITYDLTQANGVAEGYLAPVLAPGRLPGANGASEAVTF